VPTDTPTAALVSRQQLDVIPKSLADSRTALPWVILLVGTVLVGVLVGIDVWRRRRLNAVRQEYVPKVVHELRTPLAAMRGHLSMMLKGNFGQLSPAQKGPLVDVIASSQRLSSMVNDMLDTSSLEAGKIKLRTSDFALDGVVQEALASLQPLALEKQLVLESTGSGGAMVLADRDRVKQILINLIGNSLKFTDEGSIRISSQVDDELVNVFVSNTGPAMTPEQQEKLFQKFEQLGTKASGTGLGLSVARELARAMGGDLWLEKSVEGGDTTFGFSLPRATLTPTQKA
jgi:signal transduction histidine kinase